MPLPTLLDPRRDSIQRRLWVNGAVWLVFVAGKLIFDRFVSHAEGRFAWDAVEGVMLLVAFSLLSAFLAVLAKGKSGNELSITNSDRDEAHGA
jgi:hypothetical protein